MFESKFIEVQTLYACVTAGLSIVLEYLNAVLDQLECGEKQMITNTHNFN